MTHARSLRDALSLGAALPRELRSPVSPAVARHTVQEWQQQRGERFAAMLRTQVFAHSASAYRALAEWAGLTCADCVELVQREGVEGALAAMRAGGVFITLDEFKGIAPIVRGSRTFHAPPSAFRSPGVGNSASSNAVSGTTSGSTSTPRRITYSWPFIADEAAHEQVLYEAHGPQVARAPSVLWYPAPPGIAGLHNLLMDAKRGVPPARWFSQVHPSKTGSSLLGRMAPRLVSALSRSAGIVLPSVECASPDQAALVLAALPTNGMMRGFASSVVRLADEAVRTGRPLHGITLFTGGEPLTETRRQRIEASGASVYARYVATEAGVVGGSTPCRREADDMHLYTSRLAMISHEGALYLTTFSTDADTLLLNTDLGDTGTITQRSCDCVLGQLGLDTHVHGIHSGQRLTAEGMTVSVRAMGEAMAHAWQPFGVSLSNVQLRPQLDPSSRASLRIVIDQPTGVLDDALLLAALYDELRTRGGALALAGSVWQAARTLHIVHDRLETTAGAKQPLYLA